MQIPKSITKTILFIGFVYLVGLTYIYLSSHWVDFGRGLLTFNSKIFFIELPFFSLLSLCFYFPSSKYILARNLLPVFPALILYILFDAFYNFFGRAATPSDFQNVSDIFSFSTSLAVNLIVIYLLIPFSVFLSIILNRNHTFSQLKVSLFVRLCILVVFIGALLIPITKDIQKLFFNYTVWAQEDTIRENGRFNSSIFYALQERYYADLLSHYSSRKNNDINIKTLLYPGEIRKHKNVHVIVMESFIDPRLVTELKLPKNFISRRLTKHLNLQESFSHIISPIYGGGTAQAEFELLTGIKALSKVNQIEFNTMQGNPVNTFVNELVSNNYSTHAMVAPSSEFFNSKRAYRSVGFDMVNYLQEKSTSTNSALLNYRIENEMLYDGDLFNLNIKYLKEYLGEQEQPIFNYVLGMYGHLPFERNLKLRPDKVSPKHIDDRLNRIANQFYYRADALAKYLEELIKIDPTSIIFVTSDHLPSVLSADAHYQLNNKINIALFINSGKTIDVNEMHLYQIPWLIWKLLTINSDSRVPKIQSKLPQISDKVMDELYFNALSESLNK